NKKFKVVGDVEFRTTDFVNDIERRTVGVKVEYKILKWLKANVGYSFMYTHKPEEVKMKYDDIVTDIEGNNFVNYNIDHDYWVVRDRFYATISGEHKIGRFEIGLRERLQYTHTSSGWTNETKYRYDLGDEVLSTDDNQWTNETEPEFKDAKNNLTLRSRLNVKYDIPNCKINPFASVELYTRLDEWKGCDKLRYRVGGSYKINKDNSISFFYLYQDANDDDEPKGHAIGFEYSIDL
ncbi:MAG: DUF2490 domain-containing protein, partial [Bacteroidaceae bacterium]|nr:DUF2490 domain-containing protein [Bacteroidaceae bacterium]